MRMRLFFCVIAVAGAIINPVFATEKTPQLPAFACETDHFTVYAPDQVWASQAAAHLEHIHQEFFNSLTKRGFKITTSSERLVWLCFASREEFNQYAVTIDEMDLSNLDGYYSTRTNRVALFPIGENSSLAGGQYMPAAEPHVQNVTSLGTTAATDELSRAAHEAAHQLAFNSGLQKRSVMYPFWVSEGLATNFEADPDGKVGFARANPARRTDLVRVWAEGRLMPLDDLVVLSGVYAATDLDAMAEMYAQAWGLFRFLMQTRPQDVVAYFEYLEANPSGRCSSELLHRRFTQAFGSTRQIEQEWANYLRALAE